MTKYIFLLLSIFMVTMCNKTSVFELAINESKEGKHQEFLDSRKQFVALLGKEKAALNEGKWAPFFAVNPQLDLKRILAGMTEWESIESFQETGKRLLPGQIARDYFSTFTPLVYVVLEPADGKPFDIESIQQQGNVVEFAVRHGKTSDAFGEKRDYFFNSLKKYPGYRFAREFKVMKLDASGIPKPTKNTQAVIIVWENVDAFQAAAQPVFASAEYNQFSENLEVEAYFATFPVD